jgi:signal transduction histidine kinase
MSSYTSTERGLAAVLANALREGSVLLSRRWLDRIAERANIEPDRVFPTQAVLDSIPRVIEGIADYVENPVNEVGADTVIITKAIELGGLRFQQGFDVYEILKEYELLGGILFCHLAAVADRMVERCDQRRLLLCSQRLFRAVHLIQQASILHFVRLTDERKAEREEELRTFNRAVSHEIKNRIGTLLGAAEALRTIPIDDAAQRTQFVDMLARNARSLQHTVENLVSLSRTDNDARQHHNLQLAVAAREAARQLRENARAAHVEIRVEQLPQVEVNAAAVELCVTNYLSNAIKYADPNKPHRYAAISGDIESSPTGGREVVVRVRDNGLGVPVEKRRSLFQRFYRAHDATTAHADGTGLGLSIVSETVASLGGRAWAEFPATGSVFAFSLPYRRAQTSDAA